MNEEQSNSKVKSRAHRWTGAIVWGLFIVYYSCIAAIIAASALVGVRPPDFNVYMGAAQAIEREESPYRPVEEVRAGWLAFNALTPQTMIDDPAATLIVGPYLYPPTLALLYNRLLTDNVAVNSVIMTLLFAGSVLGFVGLWLHTDRSPPWWMLLALLSVEVTYVITSSNADGLLVAATLVGAWLTFTGRGLWAAPPIAFAVLVKPFFGLFFAAFGLILLAGRTDHAHHFRTLTVAAVGSLALVAVDIALWGDFLRAEAWAYLTNAIAYTWYALPTENQFPFSIWNRSAMQVMVNAGVAVSLAQGLGYALWTLMLGVTLWRVRGRDVPFRLAFAIALVMLYWCRPVSWALLYLELVVVSAVWPYLGRRARLAVLLVALTLMAARWAMLLQTLAGQRPQFLTVQSADFPWEGWLLLPACWGLLVVVARQEQSAIGKI